MKIAAAPAKINLALVVGPRRDDGLHRVATVLQPIDLCDSIGLEPAGGLAVQGFADDTLVRAALERLGEAAGVAPAWRVVIQKRIPVAAGLGGGSSDAATALRLANETLARPLRPDELAALAAEVGADVPSFLAGGPSLAEGAGEDLTPLELPREFFVVVALAGGAAKPSTGAVYRRFDELGGGDGYAGRRERLLAALARTRHARDLAELPENDLAAAAGRSDLVDRLRQLGAFRADVSGAGPAVYGLFERADEARAAASGCGAEQAWAVSPLW